MPLTLTIRSGDPAAAPPPLRLEGNGATIGRAPGCDWTLPDDRATISSRHCSIAFHDGVYVLTDTSTNGTALNGRRIETPQRLSDGDAIGIGPYEIGVTIGADAVAAAPAALAATPPPAQAERQPSGPAAGGGLDLLLRAAGVRRADVAAEDHAILEAAGRLLRELTAGTAMLRDHSRRAREQIGVAAMAGGTEQSAPAGLPLPALLGDPESSRRVAALFDDLDAHQLAALKGMQAAMAATLDRFSPAAIRKESGGKADDAALWQAYQRTFGAAETGFGAVFAAEFRTAYEGLTSRQPPR